MLNVGIIGLGLIGSSLAMALKANCPLDYHIAGTDTDVLTVAQAQEMGIIDSVIIDGNVNVCDIIFICSPLSAIPGILSGIGPFLKPGAVVTDVGSVKGTVMEWFSRSLPPNVSGIGGHPMAGSDKSGIAAADGHLFENAVWVLTPPADGDTEALTTLSQLLICTGAVLRVMPAELHDEAVSRVSHLPHLAAVCLVNTLAGVDEYLTLAGGGLRDTTRIAGSQASLWVDILLSNRSKVIEGIDDFMEKLALMRHTLESGCRPDLVEQLQRAREIRNHIPQRRESLRHAADVIAMVPDQPGIIGRLGCLLGEAGINIHDIQVLGVRDEDEGSLRLAVPEVQAEQAVRLLEEAGIRAWVRS